MTKRLQDVKQSDVAEAYAEIYGEGKTDEQDEIVWKRAKPILEAVKKGDEAAFKKEASLSRTNWYGKVTKAIMKVLGIKRAKNLSDLYEQMKSKTASSDRQEVAQKLVKLAKELVGRHWKEDLNYSVTGFSYEDGKFYSEGTFQYEDEGDALKWAKRLVRDGYDAVVWSGDYLVGYGGPNMNERLAMRWGTGTVNQLTKKEQPVKRIR